MPLDDETQAAIKAAVEAAMAPVIQSATEAVNSLKKNRDDILAEKKALQSKQPKSAVERYDEWEAGYNARQAAAKVAPRQDVKHTAADITTDGKVIIPKGASPAEYQRLKKLAVDAKAEIVWAGDDGDPALSQNQRTGVVRAHDFKFEGTRFVSADRLRELGGPVKARREIGEYVTFKSLSDLSEGARAAHDTEADDE